MHGGHIYNVTIDIRVTPSRIGNGCILYYTPHLVAKIRVLC